MAGLSKDGDIFLFPKFKILLYCCNMYFQFLFTIRKILGKMNTHAKINNNKKKRGKESKHTRHTFQKVGSKAVCTHWKILVLISQNSSIGHPLCKIGCSLGGFLLKEHASRIFNSRQNMRFYLQLAPQYLITCYCKLSMKSHILIFKFLFIMCT